MRSQSAILSQIASTERLYESPIRPVYRPIQPYQRSQPVCADSLPILTRL
jgi:hypothetical protein